MVRESLKIVTWGFIGMVDLFSFFHDMAEC